MLHIDGRGTMMGSMRMGAVMVAVGVGMAQGASAQVLPFERTDAGRARAELHAAVFGEFQTVLAAWVEAVNARDAERVAALYDEGAFVFLGDSAVQPGALDSSLRDWLAGLGSVSFNLSSFDASSSLSYGAGRVVITPAGSGPGSRGTMLLVLRRHDRDDWRIRSQTLLLEPPAASAAAQPAAKPPAASPGW